MLRRLLAVLAVLAAVPAGAGVVCSSTNKSCGTSAGGGGGPVSFPTITSGTNTAAAMLVGTGASLGITGTGTIAASTTNIIIANEGVTGTTANYLAKLTGAPSTAVVAGTSDTSGIVGIVVSGAGTTGSALIARSGSASCAFDGATTAGDYVIVSTTAAGKCHDTGAATYPSGNIQVLGRVLSTNVGAGTYAMTLHMGTQGGMVPLSSDGTNITLASGQLLLPAANSCTAPALAFTGNTTTGICQAASGQLDLRVAGTNRLSLQGSSTVLTASLVPDATGTRTLGSTAGGGLRWSYGAFGGQTLTTTVTPQVNIDGVTWNDSGTTHQLIYGNVTDTASAAASTLIDLRVGSASKFSVRKDGALTAASMSTTGSGAFISGSSGYFYIGSRATWYGGASDGIMYFDGAGSGTFNRMGFGGLTSSFPALKRSSAGLVARLADDSADTTVTMSTPIVTGTSSPASGAACTTGTITWDASYIYVCTASAAWKRAALTGGY